MTGHDNSALAKIAALFPHCIRESRDAHGKPAPVVDFDLLRQELAGALAEGPQERYRLDWPGKRAAILAANTPPAHRLRPCPAESVDFEHTHNLFIEGDNLEALKLLQADYTGKVKMIYIDRTTPVTTSSTRTNSPKATMCTAAAPGSRQAKPATRRAVTTRMMAACTPTGCR